MFLVDDLLLAPFSGLLWVFKQIYEAAEQEQAQEAESLTESLGELYRKLETGAVTEEEFAAGEKMLLDRLEAIQGRDEDVQEEPEDESEVTQAEDEEIEDVPAEIEDHFDGQESEDEPKENGIDQDPEASHNK
ncbi:MAG: gas vesicle protein GvpG [Acidobacteria bacterium]|nr:gas vesicle protein GvpG [Acidobacteriota bacterium]